MGSELKLDLLNAVSIDWNKHNSLTLDVQNFRLQGVGRRLYKVLLLIALGLLQR